jgi:hypothetical protein
VSNSGYAPGCPVAGMLSFPARHVGSPGGDRLIPVSSYQRPVIGRDTAQQKEFAHASHHL